MKLLGSFKMKRVTEIEAILIAMPTADPQHHLTNTLCPKAQSTENSRSSIRKIFPFPSKTNLLHVQSPLPGV